MSEHAMASRTHDAAAPEQAPAPPVRAEQQQESAERAPALAGLAVRRRGGQPHDPLGGTAASGDVVDALRRRQGAGAPLAPDVAASFGDALGADLTGVRVHTDPEAQQIARSVQATAFTHGSDVYFGQGAFNPSSEAGQHLLGHELTHVVQQATGLDQASGGTTIGRADDPLEKAADESASRVVSTLRRQASGAENHQHAPGCGHGDAAPGRLQRVLALTAPEPVAIQRKKGGAVNTAVVGPRIAKGHAYDKHVVEEGQFVDLGIDSVKKFAAHIDTVIWDGEGRTLADGRLAYWHEESGTVVIYNPKAVDSGTCFRPDLGRAYYQNLV